jgi:hypothetical protein
MQIELRRVGPYVYDLFQGNQWETWSRVRKGRSSTFVLEGERLPHNMLKELDKILTPNMPITYGQDLETMLRNNEVINRD